MDAIWWVVIAVAALVILALVAWSYSQSRRRAALRDQFGPEYDRTVSGADSRRQAERDLAERERAHESLDIHPLSEAAVTRYTEDWQRAQQRFVDDPELAAREADRIVRSVLEERGYPKDDFDEQAAAVSVDLAGRRPLPPRARHGARQRREPRSSERRTSGRRWSTSAPCSRSSSRPRPRQACAPSAAVRRTMVAPGVQPRRAPL